MPKFSWMVSFRPSNTGLPTSYVQALAIDRATPTTLYAGTDDGVFKSTSGGGNWSVVNTSLPRTHVPVLSIDPVTPTTLHCGDTYGTNHTAALLQDGRVLVMAGSPQSGGPPTPDDRVEISDPRTNRWEQAATHEYTGGSHTATLLTGGQVLIAGGNADPAIYDPEGDTWQPAGHLTADRWESQAVRLQDGRVLLIGGWSPYEDRPIDSVEIYDPASNSWRQVAPLAQARYRHTVTLLPDGRVPVSGGGRLHDSHRYDPGAILSNVELYDPTSDTWSALPPLQQARAMHPATLLSDGRVFVAGGYTTYSVILDSTAILTLAGP
jgi:hypothetical protein